jgi:hypothetical protein
MSYLEPGRRRPTRNALRLWLVAVVLAIVVVAAVVVRAL